VICKAELAFTTVEGLLFFGYFASRTPQHDAFIIDGIAVCCIVPGRIGVLTACEAGSYVRKEE
jgi:hypothetical protein